MAINFVVSYTFAPSTTISSSQVNTNTSDEANVWTGLEALTKSFAKLKVDVDPSTALEVATKQYVDHYSTYRRPVLQFNTVTVTNIETGINGTSGQAQILFPDGTIRTDSTTSRIDFDITRNAALSGTAQSGLRTSLSEATNTWYAIYAVKVTDSSTNFVAVGDTLLPVQANYATLNSNFGTNGWVYLGLIRNGDNSGATGDILSFWQSGNATVFSNIVAGNSRAGSGIRLATSAGATSLTYTYAAGTGTAQIPANITLALYGGTMAACTSPIVLSAAGNIYIAAADGGGATKFTTRALMAATDGMQTTNGGSSSIAQDIYFSGFFDGVLGVGANPIL